MMDVLRICFIMFCLFCLLDVIRSSSTTSISIKGDDFYINNEKTYSSASNSDVHGLLINSRMINAIFDNSNSQYDYLFEYPDTGKWDPNRNVDEFVNMLSTYKSYGLLCFSVGLQGGNPFGYNSNIPDGISGQPWVVSAYTSSGELNMDYFDRLESILEKTDELGMVPMVELFYANQVSKMSGNTAVMNAINNTLDWFMSTKYTNFLIEVANEYNYISNDLLNPDGIASTIDYVRDYSGGKYLISASIGGSSPPGDDVLAASDYILMHGNGRNAAKIKSMISEVKENSVYKNDPKPIMFNEDDHYDWTENGYFSNFYAAVSNHVSWGVFVDCNKTTAGDYIYGYQCVPPNWNINTPTKQGFFNTAKSYTS